MSSGAECKICGAGTQAIGSKRSEWRGQWFSLRRCRNCGYAFVVDPLTDYAVIYSDNYYAGQGADPLVDYYFELEHPEQSIRTYEWRGILSVVKSLMRLKADTKWLDFGCGNGGLVRYCRAHEGCQIVGFEEGAIRKRAVEWGIPFVDRTQLDGMQGTFDVITAIEVFEHLENPMEVLRYIQSLLKPEGLLFYTTGNARPHRRNLKNWSYVIPELHISFYEPETLSTALRLAGFVPDFQGYRPGFTDIIRFKVLKNLRVRRRCWWERMLPWGLVARPVDWYFKVSAHPVARAGSKQI
jgi:SAM-dependent methyltransferase